MAENSLTRRYWWTFALAPLIVVGLHPRVLNPALRWLFRVLRRQPPGQAITLRGEAIALGWGVAAWVAYGLHIWVIVHDLGATGGRALPVAIGSFALAWTVGFLVVVAPAGAGAREAVLVLGLAPLLSAGTALVVAIMSRVLLTVADFALAGVAIAARRSGAMADRAEPVDAASRDAM